MEIVQKAFKAHGTGGIEAVLPYYASDVVLYMAPEWIEDETYRGHDGARRADDLFAENFDDFAWELQETRAVEDRVLALAEMTGRMKATGSPIREPTGIVAAKFHDGRVGEVRFYITWRQAIEAVGLE